MTDVVKIAKERQARLAAEIARLDEFVRMAEKLLKYNQLELSKASGVESEKAAESTGPATARPYSGTTGANVAEADA